MMQRATLLGSYAASGLSRTLRTHAVLPNDAQLALFHAIFATDTDFVPRWNQWASLLPPDFTIDPVSYQNLPLLQKRLPTNPSGLNHFNTLSKLIHDAYRRSWAINHLIFRSLQSSLQVLHSVGIQTLVLKGAALINLYYKDMGARSMGDFDVLVSQSQFLDAARALEAAGWSPHFRATDFDARFAHALTFDDGKGNYLDLHAHVMHITSVPGADQLFWDNSVPISFSGVHTRALCDADCILNLAEHGLGWVPLLPLRWIPDIACVINRGTTDWNRLLWMARHLHKSVAVALALEFIHQNNFALVPETVLTQLHKIPVDRWERIGFELSARNTLGSYFQTVRSHWHIMGQTRQAGGPLRRLPLLPAYINYCAKRSGHRHWLHYFFAGGIFKKHMLAKFGLYERP